MRIALNTGDAINRTFSNETAFIRICENENLEKKITKYVIKILTIT